MKPRVLLVDDEPHVLAGYRRSLRKNFEVVTNEIPADALKLIESGEEFAVVVSDFRMPEMNGVEFLAKVREIAPNTVRIMLTGQADQAATIDAINRSDVFRYLTKPCPVDALISTIESGAEHYRLLNAETELLDGTLQQIVGVLIELIGLVDPAVQRASADVRKLVAAMCKALELDNAWEFELAGQVSQLGTIALPASIVERYREGLALSSPDQVIFDGHPQSAYNLLVQIPRLDRVARMVLAQNRPSGTRPLSIDAPDEDDIVAIGAHLLSLATGFQRLITQQLTPAEAVDRLRALPGPQFRTAALDALASGLASGQQYVHAALRVDELGPGMILDEAINSAAGLLLLAAGSQVTQALIERILRYDESSGVEEPIRALIPASQATAAAQ